MQLLPLQSIKNSRVFLRADFDVPIRDGGIESTYRIERAIPTIETLLKQKNKLTIFTKIGRPEKKDNSLSTKNLIPFLEKVLKTKIDFVDQLKNAGKSNIYLELFENTRFFNFEENLDRNNAKLIEKNFDIYVDEAFAMSHRRESSNFEVPKILQKCSLGINYKQEVKYLSKIRVGDFLYPSLFILGGVKAETKIPMIQELNNKISYFIVGGLLVLDPTLSKVKEKYPNIRLLKLNESKKDIDTQSTEILQRSIKLAKTIIWNGPLGKFEEDPYGKSTEETVKSLKDFSGLKIAGGGDTIAAIEKYNALSCFDFISTGGGAMFSFLAGNKTNIEYLFTK